MFSLAPTQTDYIFTVILTFLLYNGILVAREKHLITQTVPTLGIEPGSNGWTVCEKVDIEH